MPAADPSLSQADLRCLEKLASAAGRTPPRDAEIRSARRLYRNRAGRARRADRTRRREGGTHSLAHDGHG